MLLVSYDGDNFILKYSVYKCCRLYFCSLDFNLESMDVSEGYNLLYVTKFPGWPRDLGVTLSLYINCLDYPRDRIDRPGFTLIDLQHVRTRSCAFTSVSLHSKPARLKQQGV